MDDDSCGQEGEEQKSVNDVETGADADAPDNSVQTKFQFAETRMIRNTLMS